MSKQVSPTLIGSFFLTALGLVIIAIIMFGGGSYFEKHHKFVLYFHSENNLNGLNVGAPVKLEGVKIGEVKEVALLLDENTVQRMWIMRKYLADMNPVEAMEFINDRIKKSLNNEEFLISMNS